MNICVFCASSDHVDTVYTGVARELGIEMASRGMTLVYGGGNNGLMGVLSKELHDRGGTVIGVIPELLKGLGYAYAGADEMVVTDGMRERKAVMEERADGFICLPGGFGTLEEILEIITLRQLGFHNKPVVIINRDGFFDGLLSQFERAFGDRFVHEKHRALYHITDDVADALDQISRNPGETAPRKQTIPSRKHMIE